MTCIRKMIATVFFMIIMVLAACEQKETESLFGSKIIGDASGYQVNGCGWGTSGEELKETFVGEKLEEGLDGGLYSELYKAGDVQYQYSYFFEDDEKAAMNRFLVYYHCPTEEVYQELSERIAEEARAYLSKPDADLASLEQLEEGAGDVTVYWSGEDQSSIQIYTQRSGLALYVQAAAPSFS